MIGISKQRLLLVITVLGILVMGTACSVLQEPAAPSSATLEAVPLAVNTVETAVDPSPTAEPLPTETAVPTEAYTDAAADPTTEPTAVPEPTEIPPTAEPEPTEASGELVVFTLSQADSQVRFEIDEDLAGVRNTVVGTTDQVSGQLAANYSDLSTAQVGVILINARTLVTDNQFRNRAISNQILDTGDFEFITFTPTSVTGLPDSVNIGDAIEFTIVGDLTIRDTTTEVTFTVTAKAISDTQISGSANATISREAYGVSIPSVPNVANVEDEVELYIDFVANAQ